MNLKTFRYAVCGATNTAVGYIVYYVSFKYILKTQDLDMGFFEFKSHMAALFMSFLISFPFGFFLMKYVVFSDSNLRGKVQLFRYFLVIMGCMVINYICLKIFVEHFGWYPTPSQLITTGVVILFNYFSQRYFSFRKDKKALEAEGLQA